MTRTPAQARRGSAGPLTGALRALPGPGSRYARVRLDGDTGDVVAFLPAALAAGGLALQVDDRVLLDMVGRLPVIRSDAP